MLTTTCRRGGKTPPPYLPVWGLTYAQGPHVTHGKNFLGRVQIVWRLLFCKVTTKKGRQKNWGPIVVVLGGLILGLRRHWSHASLNKCVFRCQRNSHYNVIMWPLSVSLHCSRIITPSVIVFITLKLHVEFLLKSKLHKINFIYNPLHISLFHVFHVPVLKTLRTFHAQTWGPHLHTLCFIAGLC